MRPAQTDKSLDSIRWNLRQAEGRAKVNPTPWNVAALARLRQAEIDYQMFLAGEIESHQMCHTAQELSMSMPAWGTYGT